jgi:peptidoglycan/xylan/chitin deacetylase (PgdA/CDA1 family)
MLMYMIVRFSSIAVLAILLTGSWLYNLSPWWMLVPALIYPAIISYGAFSIRSGMFLKALSSANTNEKKIALTFDDGPHPEITPVLLNLLKTHHIKAGFFCIGKMVKDSPELLRRTDDDGHLIGSHTYSHAPLIDFYSAARIKEELA